jgi:hypothetical protein
LLCSETSALVKTRFWIATKKEFCIQEVSKYDVSVVTSFFEVEMILRFARSISLLRVVQFVLTSEFQQVNNFSVIRTFIP